MKRKRVGTGRRIAPPQAKQRLMAPFIPPRRMVHAQPMQIVPGVSRVGGFYGRYSKPGGELKFFDTSYSGTIDATGEVAPGGGTATSPNLIPQGVTESTRVGRKCVIRKISLQGFFWSGTLTGAAAAPNVFKLALVLDTQANGAYPAFSDVQGATVNSFNNLANSQRFRVLKIWKKNLQTPGIQVAGTPTYIAGMPIPFKWNHKCNIPLEFSSTTGAITEIRSNNLLFTQISTADDVVQYDMITRIRFSDS